MTLTLCSLGGADPVLLLQLLAWEPQLPLSLFHLCSHEALV